jgi:hypothetical protein
MSNLNPGVSVSEQKKPRSKKPVQRRNSRPTKFDGTFPVEVIVYDCVKHERCVAEYRNESKWWYGTRLHKVYHPNFIEPVTPNQPVAYRWVMKIVKVLGGFDPNEPIPTQDEAKA